MKILRGDFYFALPDDFNGSRAEALRLLADYDESTLDRTKPTDDRTLWERFLEARGNGFRLAGVLNHQVFDDQDWKIQPREKK